MPVVVSMNSNWFGPEVRENGRTTPKVPAIFPK